MPGPAASRAPKRSSRNGVGLTGERAPVIRAAIISPTAGDSLKPWPDMPAAIQKPRTGDSSRIGIQSGVMSNAPAYPPLNRASASAGNRPGGAGQHVLGLVEAGLAAEELRVHRMLGLVVGERPGQGEVAGLGTHVAAPGQVQVDGVRGAEARVPRHREDRVSPDHDGQLHAGQARDARGARARPR